MIAAQDWSGVKLRLKTTWMSGDYDRFSRFLEAGARDFFERLEAPPGARLLDVACGSGQLALIAARAGVKATGCDIAVNWIEKARMRASDEGLDVAFDEGDAEALPYQDGTFDLVASLIGAMFAPRPELAAAEMARVCRRGGKIAMANWTSGGFVGKMFGAISRHIAPSGMPAPALWGDPGVFRERFGASVSRIETKLRTYHFDYPFPPAGVVDFFRANYGPMARAFASLGPQDEEILRGELVELWSAHNKARGERTRVDAEYLEAIAVRA